jgi:hypothetical protein
MAMHRDVDTEPFRAPADDDPSPDILRHAFLGEPLPDNKPNQRQCNSESDAVRWWELFIRTTSSSVYLDGRPSSSPYSMSISRTCKELRRLFAGSSLDTILDEQRATSIADANADSNAELDDKDGICSSEDVEVNADDEVDDDAVAPNTSDTSTSTGHVDHGTHIELQDQTASEPELFGGGAPYAVFDCPAYNTVFNPLYPMYLFYRHLSKPGH